MADRKDHITNSKDYQRYLDDQMTPKERHDFEKHLLDDDFESEALEGFSQFTSGGKLDADINRIKNKLRSRTKDRDAFVYWRIAAAILLLGTFSFIIYFIIDFDSAHEVAQNKKASPKEETEFLKEPVKVIADSAKELEVPIIAYKQEVQKNERSTDSKQSQEQTKKRISDAPVELESIKVLDSDEALLEEDKMKDLAAPFELPDVAYDQEREVAESVSAEQVIEEIRPQAEILTSAPAAAKKMESSTARREKAARSAKTKTVTGKISSAEDDEGIPGVNVIVKGSSAGTVTDIEGDYSIDVPTDSDVTLVIASVGYMTEEVEIVNHDEIDVTIDPDVTALSEIVVVGSGASGNSDGSEYSYTPPTPVGGNGEFKNFVEKNIHYPNSGLAEQIKGTVKLKFAVENDGQISKMEVLRSLGADFDKEAIRLVNEGPKWEPARKNDSFVVREVKVKIRFRPPD